MANVIRKGLIGKQDIRFYSSASPTFSRVTSTGGSTTLNSVAATHIPIVMGAASNYFTQNTVQRAVTELGRDKVSGPASAAATNLSIAVWSGSAGRLLKSSGVTLSSLNNITGVNEIDATNVVGLSSVSSNTIITSPSYVGGVKENGWTCNLGCTYSGGTFTITDAVASAISINNEGWVTIPSNNHGRMDTLSVQVPFVFKDAAGASDLTNLEFGVTAGANWAQDVPFFIYAVNRAGTPLDGTNGNSCFAIARNPCMTKTPASANSIGNTTTIPVTDDEKAILLMGDSYTVANYVSLPCALVGSFRMQYATATHDWTVQTLAATDGIGKTQVEKTLATRWTFPLGQNGAATGTYVLANGGTAPIFTTNTYEYIISRNGICNVFAKMISDGGTDGGGAVDTYVSLPYGVNGTNANIASACGIALGATTITGQVGVIGQPTIGSASILLLYQSSATATSSIQNSMFSNGSRTIQLNLGYSAF